MLRKVMRYILDSCGYVEMTEYNAAIYTNDVLMRENRELKAHLRDLNSLNKSISAELSRLDDENKSLWDMLDEINASNNFGSDQVKSIMKDIEEVMTDEMLKDFKPIGEA